MAKIIDRNLLRKLAKAKYKEMMKATPKRNRVPFAQIFPMIKASLENNLDVPVKINKDEVAAESISANDADLIQSMVEGAVEEHVHTDECNHN